MEARSGQEKVTGPAILVKAFPVDCLSTCENGSKYLCVGTAEDYAGMNLNAPKGLSMDVSTALVIYHGSKS